MDILNKIKEHTEHWKKVCGYRAPYDYEGLYQILKSINRIDNVDKSADFNKKEAKRITPS